MSSKKPNTANNSYQNWVDTYGIDSKKIYDSNIKNAETDYKKALSGYGALSESLSSKGLSGSGYSDYINGKAYQTLQKSKADALMDYADNQRKNIKSYSDYITSKQNEAGKLKKDIANQLLSKKITSYDDAFDYAVSAGVDAESAREIAKLTTGITKNEIKKEIGNLAIKNNMTSSEARLYALFSGLSQAEADEIADFVIKYNEHYSYSDDSYMDNLIPNSR